VLNDREKDVLMQRRLSEDPVTLEELSESYGVSRERIRQIEVRAFEKLQAQDARTCQGQGNGDPGVSGGLPKGGPRRGGRGLFVCSLLIP
jgi:RNA polymerase sigma-32 factor